MLVRVQNGEEAVVNMRLHIVQISKRVLKSITDGWVVDVVMEEGGKEELGLTNRPARLSVLSKEWCKDLRKMNLL